MIVLALLVAAVSPEPKTQAVAVEATATVRILKAAKLSAIAAAGTFRWSETVVHDPDGTVEKLRVIDLP